MIRDPAKNALIAFPLEKNKAHFTDGFESMLRATAKLLADRRRPDRGVRELQQAARRSPDRRPALASAEQRASRLLLYSSVLVAPARSGCCIAAYCVAPARSERISNLVMASG